MPTVKLQNGKVLLKDGKVSCTCCDGPEPEECCMYPADGLGDTYDEEDLPDVILINGLEAEKTTEFNGLSTPIGYLLGDGETIGDIVIAWHDTNVIDPPGERYIWLSYELVDFGDESYIWEVAGIKGDPCLFDSFFVVTEVEDQFADCYEWDGGYTGPVILTRQSLCVWSGLDICGTPVYLFYCTADGENLPSCGGDIHKWYVLHQVYFFRPLDFGCEDNPPESGAVGIKDGDQNTPEGTYKEGTTVMGALTAIECP
jgi:hypothetical protein